MNFDMTIEDIRKPLPDFSREEAISKIRPAEDAWNNRYPVKVATAYSLHSEWRNRDRFIHGRMQETGLQCASCMSQEITVATGFALTAMKTGNSVKRG